MVSTEFFGVHELAILQVSLDRLVVLLLLDKEQDQLCVHELVLLDDLREFGCTKTFDSRSEWGKLLTYLYWSLFSRK